MCELQICLPVMSNELLQIQVYRQIEKKKNEGIPKERSSRSGDLPTTLGLCHPLPRTRPNLQGFSLLLSPIAIDSFFYSLPIVHLLGLTALYVLSYHRHGSQGCLDPAQSDPSEYHQPPARAPAQRTSAESLCDYHVVYAEYVIHVVYTSSMHLVPRVAPMRRTCNIQIPPFAQDSTNN